MKLKRHKQFLKDWNKTRLTDGQFEKFIEFANCLKKESHLPPESREHSLKGKYNDCREVHLGGDMLAIYVTTDTEKKFQGSVRITSSLSKALVSSTGQWMSKKTELTHTQHGV